MTSKTQLLKSAIPHIQDHGFTLNSFLVAAPASAPSSSQEALVRRSFPGKPTEECSPERSLFRAWDDHNSEVLSSLQPRSGLALGKEGRDQAQARTIAYEDTVSLLSKRLLESWKVRQHLLQAFALESSLLSFALPSSLPSSPDELSSSIGTTQTGIGIPTPLPLIKRSIRIVEHGVDVTGLRALERIGPEWYSIRSKLVGGFLTAELHLLAPHLTSPRESLSLFHRITRMDNKTKAEASEIKQYSDGAQEWAKWGSRGWLGIFRSWGL